jgi:glyoxylase-like metal-dependent hydrolase (beta-lactamase superfamily II)
MIIRALEIGPFLSNCYIVGSEKTREGMIIDPGAEAETILNTVKKSGLRIVLIVATHTHIDHIGALAQVKDATKASFALHEAEKSGGAPTALEELFAPLLGDSGHPLPPPDRLLSDGDIVEIGELHFKVLHTPGHSPGGICLLGHGVVFCGDTLFNYSIGRTDFPGCSYQQLMDSIYTKLMTLPDETRVFPGHGPETTIGFERQHNPFLNMKFI